MGLNDVGWGGAEWSDGEWSDVGLGYGTGGNIWVWWAGV